MATTAEYTEGTGRRKTAAARVRITPASKRSVVINNIPLEEYFDTEELRTTATSPLEEGEELYTVTAVVKGGGVSAQAEAVRHGIARAMTERDAELRGALKKKGFLKRDPRVKERKKPGLKKARKAAQWSKR
ncbi:MAG: 30S ribosomal protein S9 [Patescibacteria group bacterium UBA2163]